jgi:hypothetical protein
MNSTKSQTRRQSVKFRSMKFRTMLSVATVCCVAGLLVVSAAYGQNSHVYRGEVSDSQCALNVHSLTRSHQEMLKSKSMGGTSNTCSVYCIEHLGGYLVLSAGKNVYRLDRADLVHGFEGQRVAITGVLDTKLNQIHVLKIDLDDKP